MLAQREKEGGYGYMLYKYEEAFSLRDEIGNALT